MRLVGEDFRLGKNFIDWIRKSVKYIPRRQNRLRQIESGTSRATFSGWGYYIPARYSGLHDVQHSFGGRYFYGGRYDVDQSTIRCTSLKLILIYFKEKVDFFLKKKTQAEHSEQKKRQRRCLRTMTNSSTRG